MPRPGPRPYECVRRAWHSDRHLPLRGSLIQEIFRLVSEVHSTATKKNKEWQEKLPIVVLRAEEIMYSKANSEADYVNLGTLRDRVNDAINTIIRRDESDENGKLLQPCIEAALHLGCTARRSSRSQQNNNRQYYLTPGNQGDPFVPPGNVDYKNCANQSINSPFVPQHPKFMTAAKTNSFPSGFASDRPIIQHANCSSGEFFCSGKSYRPRDIHQSVTIEPCASSNSYSVYPLYFGDQLQSQSSNLNFKTPTNPNSHSIEAEKMCAKRNLSSSKSGTQIVNSQAVLRCPSEKTHEVGCDLSLRLGPLGVPIPYSKSETIWSQEVENSGLDPFEEGTKLSNPSSPQMRNDFFCFPKADANERLDSSSMKRSKQNHRNIEAMVRKQKAIVSCSSENGHLVGI